MQQGNLLTNDALMMQSHMTKDVFAERSEKIGNKI
jgi:hypothetical protein